MYKKNLKNIILIQPKSILKKIYPRAIWHFDRTEKKIFLTFDDGPIPELTEWILGELQTFNAKATFFCVGDNILKYPYLFEKIKTNGHLVANHSMHHIKGFKNTVTDYLKDVESCRQLLDNNFFRPPYGQLKRSQYKALRPQPSSSSDSPRPSSCESSSASTIADSQTSAQ